MGGNHMQATGSAITAVLLFIITVFSQVVPQTPPANQTPEKPEPTPSAAKELTIFSRNEEFRQLVGSYSPDGVKLNFISEYVDEEDFQDVVNNGWHGSGIDIYIADSAELCRYIDSSLPLDELGISEAETSGLFSFNVESGKNSDGELCALPVVNAPGVFLYKRSTAKKLFGTDAPGVVQSYISDWKKFLQTAELAKSKGVYMTTNVSEMYYAFAGGSSFTDKNGKISVPSSALDWLSAAKTMTDSGYVKGSYSWTNEWMDSFTDPKIFGHFAASWLVEVLPTMTETSEDYAVCAGPQYFTWGGSYAFVDPHCGNYEAAAELLRRVCISGKMDISSQITTVISGNRSKLDEMQPILLEQTGGQNLAGIYLDVLDNVQPSSRKSSADIKLSNEFQNFMTGYLHDELGNFSINEAVDYFYDQIKLIYPEYV